MRGSFRRELERKGEATVTARTRNGDEARGTPSRLEFTLKAR
jgi:hypothetical protein